MGLAHFVHTIHYFFLFSNLIWNWHYLIRAILKWVFQITSIGYWVFSMILINLLSICHVDIHTLTFFNSTVQFFWTFLCFNRLHFYLVCIQFQFLLLLGLLFLERQIFITITVIFVRMNALGTSNWLKRFHIPITFNFFVLFVHTIYLNVFGIWQSLHLETLLSNRVQLVRIILLMQSLLKNWRFTF